MIAALPMYDWAEQREATDGFWAEVRKQLTLPDPPPQLTRGRVVDEIWLSDDLLLGQTCGYPLATRLRGKVELVATPHYAVEGCEGGYYRSALVVAATTSISDLAQTRGLRFAFNGRDSLSGYRCLSPLTGKVEDWFGEGLESGAHRNSALMVAQGEADVAAIDAVCWDLFRRFEPQAHAQLRVLCWTPLRPALPFITSLKTTPAGKAEIMRALEAAIRSDAARALRLVGVSQFDMNAYESLADL